MTHKENIPYKIKKKKKIKETNTVEISHYDWYEH